jgi:putative two-component system response regulator
MEPSPVLGGKPTILVVDDAPDNLSLMSDLLLRAGYRVKLANGGERALKIAAAAPAPDLILLDVMMPGIDGYETMRRLRADTGTRDIPVIFLTSRMEEDDQMTGLDLGAVDYIGKPIVPRLVLARVRNHLELKHAKDCLRDRNVHLEAEVALRTREIQAIQDVTINALASLAETRDNETGNHIRRTQRYVRILAAALRDHERFAGALSERVVDLLFKSAPLHDIGKVGIPDRILLKPGRLDDEEFAIMKTHTTLGRDAIVQAERQLGMEVEFLRMAKEIAYSHQEKWDGSGYPEGLSGDDIPLSARLMAVADVYDALISQRIYKPPMSHEEAVEIIVQGRGTHFDPDLVDAFITVASEFRAVAEHYADRGHMAAQ